MKEGTVERYLHDRITKLGGTTYKWVSPGSKNVPDRIVILHGIIWFVEVKILTKYPTEGQQRELNRLIKHGCNATHVSGKAGVDDFVEFVKEVFESFLKVNQEEMGDNIEQKNH